jgi:hypothetical protein
MFAESTCPQHNENIATQFYNYKLLIKLDIRQALLRNFFSYFSFENWQNFNQAESQP